MSSVGTLSSGIVSIFPTDCPCARIIQESHALHVDHHHAIDSPVYRCSPQNNFKRKVQI
jgi:hypothetical protein